MSERVDVLAVLRRLEDLAFASGADEGPEGNEPAYRLYQNAQRARAALAELIEALRQSREALRHAEPKARGYQSAWLRHTAAEQFADAALARVGGAS